jgi:hypothetical protein
MAEAFGVAAGAAGFISLSIQIGKGIDAVRDIFNCLDKTPDELGQLLHELGLLSTLLQEATTRNTDDADFVLVACRDSCQIILNSMNALEERLALGSVRGRKAKAQKLIALKHWKEEVEGLKRDIMKAKVNFLL